MVLDSDDEVAGVYLKAKDGSIDPANSFSFVSEYSESLFYLSLSCGYFCNKNVLHA